ncbi:hypothetical protein HID58_062510, partial [Brassica napus]
FPLSLSVFRCSFPYRLPGGETYESASSSKVVHAQKIEPLSTFELTNSLSLVLLRVGVTLAVPGVQRNSSERNLPSHVSHAMKLILSLKSAKLMHVLASEAEQIVVLMSVNAQVDTELPRSLAKIEGIHVPKAALPEAVAPGLDARVVNAGKVAEQAFTSDAPAKEQFAEDENGLKKAHLE